MSQENRSNLSFEIAANKERSPIYFNQEGKTGISKNSIFATLLTKHSYVLF